MAFSGLGFGQFRFLDGFYMVELDVLFGLVVSSGLLIVSNLMPGQPRLPYIMSTSGHRRLTLNSSQRYHSYEAIRAVGDMCTCPLLGQMHLARRSQSYSCPRADLYPP